MSGQMDQLARGAVYLHAAPAALCPHIEWTLSETLNAPADLRWHAQPAEPGVLRSAVNWVGPVGTGARLVDALRAWPHLWFEVTEDATEGLDGIRYSYVPDLGLYSASTSANGDIVLGELRLRELIAQGGNLGRAIENALGGPWDAALEPYRSASVGASVTWLNAEVG